MVGKVPIQSVVRAFSVLEALARSPTGVSLADLGRMVGLHKATVHRLIRTLVVLGYVKQTAEGEPYRVSGQSMGENSHAAPSPLEFDSPRHAASEPVDLIPARHRDLLEPMGLMSASLGGKRLLTQHGRQRLGRSGGGKPREPSAAIVEARK